jgi:hypothetical protein
MQWKRFLPSAGHAPRAVGVFLLLTVFFLPLHYHPANATSQIHHECSCLHGARTQAAVTTLTPLWPSLWVLLSHEPLERRLLSQSIAGFQSIRAPPIF